MNSVVDSCYGTLKMSSRNCIVYPCRRRGGYRLPLDPDLRLRWLEAIKWPIIPLEPKKTAVVCPTHFTTDDFIGVGNGGKKLLKDMAIPSVFPWNSDIWSKEEMEGTSAPRSPSTDDGEEVEKSDPESTEVSDSDIAVVSPGESSEDESDDNAEDIVLISSDDGSTSSSDTEDSEKSSVASQDAVKRSAPSTSAEPSLVEKRRRLNRPQYDIIFSTSSSTSSSSDEEEEPPKNAEAAPTAVAAKKEEDEDSDGSDCILCEKPIENIDLTVDASPPGIIYESDDSCTESYSGSGELISTPSCLTKLLDKVPIPVSDDSDCAIVENDPPTIDLNSDDEDPKSHGDQADNQVADERFTGISPFVEVPSGPLTDVCSVTVDPFADVPDMPILPPPPSGDVSPVASKDPNAPLIVRNSSLPSSDNKTASHYKNKMSLEEKKKLIEHIHEAHLPEEYQIVGISSPSESLKLIIRKKSTPDVPHRMVVSVDPLTACLHDGSPPQVPEKTREPVKVQKTASSRKSQYNNNTTQYVSLADLVVEETHMTKVILQKDPAGFEPHCKALIKKLSETTQSWRVMVDRLNLDTIKTMYELVFYCELSYGTIYWGHCDGAHEIFELQKRYVGLLARPTPQAVASRATFIKNGILTLPSIYILHCLIHVHKNFQLAKSRVEVPGLVAPIYEVQGYEFYMALPPHMRRPHCSLPNFIHILKQFFRKHGFFNALEYYDNVASIR